MIMEKIFIEKEYLKVGISNLQFFFRILEPLERIHLYMKGRHTLLESMDLHGIMPSD